MILDGIVCVVCICTRYVAALLWNENNLKTKNYVLILEKKIAQVVAINQNVAVLQLALTESEDTKSPEPGAGPRRDK